MQHNSRNIIIIAGNAKSWVIVMIVNSRTPHVNSNQPSWDRAIVGQTNKITTFPRQYKSVIVKKHSQQLFYYIQYLDLFKLIISIVLLHEKVQ